MRSHSFSKSRVAAIALAFLVSACVDTSNAPAELRPELERMDARDAAMSAEGKATYRALYSNGAKLSAFLSNTTVRHFDALHGTQVEYLGSDGKTALWYPGNAVPVFGLLKVKQTLDGPDMCFLYGQNTYNPVTDETSGRWECGDASLYLIGAAEVVNGDAFGLMQGRVPFRLSKENTTLKALAGRAGSKKLSPNKVNW
ncbi:MAG: hypothetical protein WBP15_06755 [Tabrizicola sp.]